MYGSIMPAAWSFILAARTRGLSTCWTIFHLYHAEESARLLGIPFADVMQLALIAVAYTQGQAFHHGPRKPLETMIH